MVTVTHDTMVVFVYPSLLTDSHWSLQVGELGSAVTVRGSGSVEVVTPPPVTEPKFQTFKLPELTTTPFQEPKTTAPPSTTEPSE